MLPLCPPPPAKMTFTLIDTPWIFTLSSIPPSLWSVPLALLPCSHISYSLTSVPREFEGSGVLRETEGPPSSPKQPLGLRDWLGSQQAHVDFTRRLKDISYKYLPFSFLCKFWASSVNTCQPQRTPYVQSWMELETLKQLHRLPVQDGRLRTCLYHP